MDQTSLFLRFGAALAIGILVGLEREHSHGDATSFAGVRTFALMALVGCCAALITDIMGSPWPLAGVLVVMGVLIVVGYAITGVRGEVGMTTEVSAFLTVLVGALCYWDQLALASALGVVMVVLLSLKLEMQSFARRLTREDIYAAIKLAVVSVIILPVLPNRSFGPEPFSVLNPYRIWLMVVFISGISFVGYVLIKVVGPQRGIGLTGLLGGMVSSTAVTAGLSQQSTREPALTRPFALAITVAWTVMFARVLIEVAAVNPMLLGVLWLPIAAAGVAGLLYGVVLVRSQRSAEQAPVEFSNPFRLTPALRFALFYGGILLLARTAQMFLGDTGVYLSSMVAGLADVDAITLSMAELSSSGGTLDLATAARAVVLAVMTNTAVKGGIVAVVGSPALKRAVLPGMVLMLAVGIGVAFL